jgi:hypothetical protein
MRLPWTRTPSTAQFLREAQARFVRLASNRVNAQPSSAEVERMLRTLDSGALDALLDAWAPATERAQAERYSDLRPFGHEDWKRRHGLEE